MSTWIKLRAVYRYTDILYRLPVVLLYRNTLFQKNPSLTVKYSIVVFTKVGRLYSILFFEIREGAQCAHKMTRLSHFLN